MLILQIPASRGLFIGPDHYVEVLPGRRLHVETCGDEIVWNNDTRAVSIGNGIRLYGLPKRKVGIVAPASVVVDRQERLMLAEVKERLGRIRQEVVT